MDLRTKSSVFLRYRIAPAIPVIQLLLSVYSSCFDLNFDAGNTVGYSLLTSMVYFVLFFNSKYKYCFIPQFSTLGLFVMSFCDWTKNYTNYVEYSALYDFSITIIVAVFILIYLTLCNKHKFRKS